MLRRLPALLISDDGLGWLIQATPIDGWMMGWVVEVSGLGGVGG